MGPIKSASRSDRSKADRLGLRPVCSALWGARCLASGPSSRWRLVQVPHGARNRPTAPGHAITGSFPPRCRAAPVAKPGLRAIFSVPSNCRAGAQEGERSAMSDLERDVRRPFRAAADHARKDFPSGAVGPALSAGLAAWALLIGLFCSFLPLSLSAIGARGLAAAPAQPTRRPARSAFSAHSK